VKPFPSLCERVDRPSTLWPGGTRWGTRRGRVRWWFTRRRIRGLLSGGLLGWSGNPLLVGLDFRGAGWRLIHWRSWRIRIVYRWGHGMHIVIVLLFGGIWGDLRRVRMAVAGVDLGERGAGDEELRWC
jgi:hypothetical protein